MVYPPFILRHVSSLLSFPRLLTDYAQDITMEAIIQMNWEIDVSSYLISNESGLRCLSSSSISKTLKSVCFPFASPTIAIPSFAASDFFLTSLSTLCFNLNLTSPRAPHLHLLHRQNKYSYDRVSSTSSPPPQHDIAINQANPTPIDFHSPSCPSHSL